MFIIIINIGNKFLHFAFTCCQWSHGLQPKKLSVSVAVPLAPVQFPSQRPLAPRIASVISVANDKGDNEMICAQISCHLPYSWGKPRKPSARRLSDEVAVRSVITSNGVLYLQMGSAGSHSTSERQKKGKSEYIYMIIWNILGGK